MLVTNDGEWAQRVAHPSSGLTKEYVVSLGRVSYPDCRAPRPQNVLYSTSLLGCDQGVRHAAPAGCAVLHYVWAAQQGGWWLALRCAASDTWQG